MLALIATALCRSPTVISLDVLNACGCVVCGNVCGTLLVLAVPGLPVQVLDAGKNCVSLRPLQLLDSLSWQVAHNLVSL